MSGHAQFTKFIHRTYDETLQLLEEALDYSTHSWKEDIQGLAGADTMRLTGERMRLTARLSEIMAWLMIHKAVANGEVTVEQAQSAEYHLSADDVCVDDSQDKGPDFPVRLNGMLSHSRELYARVIKMDQMASRLFGNGA